MSVAVSISQPFLACVFTLAGTAKVLDPAATRRAVESFGVATRLAPGIRDQRLLPAHRLARWRVIGIHDTDEPSLIPGRPSHGCIRVKNRAVLQLYRLMPIGTPVLIR